MRIKLISKLRKYDAAIMELGLEYTDKMAIPSGVLAFPLSGYCIAECTKTVIFTIFQFFFIRKSNFELFRWRNTTVFNFNFVFLKESNQKLKTKKKSKHFPIKKLFFFCIQALPKSGINVFGSQLHTHLRGVRVLTRHFRDNIELPHLNRDDYYSHHYQEIRYLRRQIKVYPVI